MGESDYQRRPDPTGPHRSAEPIGESISKGRTKAQWHKSDSKSGEMPQPKD